MGMVVWRKERRKEREDGGCGWESEKRNSGEKRVVMAEGKIGKMEIDMVNGREVVWLLNFSFSTQRYFPSLSPKIYASSLSISPTNEVPFFNCNH